MATEKKTCAWCKKKFPINTMVVKHAGKHNTYWCCEEHKQLTMERKQKRDEIKKRQQELEAQRKVNTNEAS